MERTRAPHHQPTGRHVIAAGRVHRTLAAITTITTTSDGTTVRTTANARHTAHVRRTVAAATTGRRHTLRWLADRYLANVPIYGPGIARAMYGNDLLRHLGLSGHVDLPEIARAVVRELDAPVRRLTHTAQATGQPHAIALLHLVGVMGDGR